MSAPGRKNWRFRIFEHGVHDLLRAHDLQRLRPPQQGDFAGCLLMDGSLVVYQRDRSSIWQCRYKVGDVWQRASTKQRDLRQAKAAARDLQLTAEIRRRNNLPVITRNFRHVAQLAKKRMEDDTKAGRGKASFDDYGVLIDKYLIPFFGNYSIANITHSLVLEFGVWRDAKMAADKRRVSKDESKTLKAPKHSTILNHNAALNQVFDEAMNRGFLTDSQRPKLENKGKPSERRPAFDLIEVRAMFSYFDGWIERGRDDKSKELRHLMFDYVEVLLDTGARPGKELMDLKWKQVKYGIKPTSEGTGKYYEPTPEDTLDEPPTEIIKTEFNRSCQMVVSGKTGTRTMLGMNPTVKALARIIQRNYGIRNNFATPLDGIAVASNDDFVFRTKDKAKPTSFQNLFTQFLTEHDLLIDPKTEKERVFYSLRHTYATLALTHDNVPIHTLAKQMGTSVGMIERHYSHLDAVKAIEQLRGYETRRLMKVGSVLEHTFVPKVKAATKSKKSISVG